MTKLTDRHLQRRAIVYVRQSTASQVANNHESRRRQYALADHARELGFRDVQVIDQDLGITSSGLKDRPGFERLVTAVCSGEVGAVFCIESSRLARNGRDWHRLLQFCAVTETLIVEPDGIFDPQDGSDRLLLGLQGAMSEYELTLLRKRSAAAIRAKAERGELQFALPVGFVWTHDGRIDLVPDLRVQGGVQTIFEKFVELGSARQVLLWHLDHDKRVPGIRFGEFGREIHWKRPSYGTIMNMLKNPSYAGAYAYGKTTNRTTVTNGRARTTRGHLKAHDAWLVLIRDHHVGYIDWGQYLRNRQTLAENTHMKPNTGRKAGRGGQALLAGKLRCGRCGRKLSTKYSGQRGTQRYECTGAYRYEGGGPCVAFGGVRVDTAVSRQVLRIVEAPALEAAVEAHNELQATDGARLQGLKLELEEADYAVRVARRRYDAVDPDNRLVASALEKSWEQALERASHVRRQLGEAQDVIAARQVPSLQELQSLSQDVPRIWNSEQTDMRLKQRIVGILLQEIVVDIDVAASEVVLTLHWTGGRHSALRVPKNRSGRNMNATGPDASAVISAMVGRFTDMQIATTLNRGGHRTGKGNTWTESRVRGYRSHRKLPAYEPTARSATDLTLDQAAMALGVSPSSVRRLLKQGILAAHQAIAGAPWEIPVEGLQTVEVKDAVGTIKSGKKAPRCIEHCQETLNIPGV